MTGNPVGLVEFLTQRLDDEAAAWSGGLDLATRPEFAKLAEHQLADIAAKRRLIAYWSLAFTNPADVQFAGPDWDKVRRAGEWTLKLLAAPFSSHPDWQPEWSVE